jgi:membrane fusion protein (multidrug efflux system)
MNLGGPLGGFFAMSTSSVIPLALLLVGCGSDPGAQAEESTSAEVPHNVRVLELQTNDLQEYLTISGPVRAKRATDVSTEEMGVVQALPRDKGALVRKNDVLVMLDRELLDAQRRSAEATVELQEFNETRIRKLQQAKSVSESELREVETLLEQSRRAAEIARLRYERAAVKAPFDGVVADRYVEVGQLVTAGSPVARVVDPFVLTLEGWVTEKDVRWTREGVSALVALDGSDAPVEGKVRWVSIEADPGTGKFAVEIDVPNPDLQLRLGVVGRARVVKTVHENVIAIPRDALVESPTGTAVYVVEGDRAQPREVALGPDQGVMVVVRRGLQAGDRLVVRGQRELSPGSRVHVQEIAENPDGTISTDPVVVRREVDSPVRPDMERSSRLEDQAP